MSNKYDVGIVGFWYGLNYGSVLTYYALYKAIVDTGKTAILVNKPTFLWDNKFYDNKTLANSFFSAQGIKRSRIRTSDLDWWDMNNFCEQFVVGSDVVWKSSVAIRTNYFFYLNWVASNKKKIAYACSFGGEWGDVNNIVTNNARYYLSKFDFVSCREFEGIEILSSVFQIEGVQTLDPVFIIDRSEFFKLAAKSTIALPKHYICSYILGPGKTKRVMLTDLQKKLGNIKLINIVNAGNEQKGTRLLGLDTVTSLSIEDWLQYICKCDLYIGDSFHGICLSIIFKKNFILIRNRVSPSRCRFDTLLKICGLENRSIYADEDISVRGDLLEPIDYESVYQRLEPFITHSKNWIFNALNSKKHCYYNDYDELKQMIDKLKDENKILKEAIENISVLLQNRVED